MSCMHMPMICKECLGRTLDAKFLDVGLQDIACPFGPPKCKVCARCLVSTVFLLQHARQVILDEEDIRHGICEQRGNWEKQQRSKIQITFNMIPCAAPDCGEGFFREDIGDRTTFTCQSCKQSTCIECNTLVHPGRSCEENQAIICDAAAELGSDVKKCPQCGAKTCKGDDACDKLTCTMCSGSFCAKCSAPYFGKFGLRQTDNSAHEPTCSHYSDPDPGCTPIHVLRKAEEEKSKLRHKSESPPPPLKTFFWTIITDADTK